MAVADVFSAITEDRPYRSGMDRNAATALLREMGGDGHLDAKVVACLCDYYEEINAVRERAQAQAVAGYESFMSNLRNLDFTWAKESHISWTRRLKEAVQRGAPLEPQALTSPEQCLLGQWYAGEGLAYYGHLPQFRALEQPHRELHRKAAEIVRHLQAGRRADAERSTEGLDRLSGEVVHLLDRIERVPVS